MIAFCPDFNQGILNCGNFLNCSLRHEIANDQRTKCSNNYTITYEIELVKISILCRKTLLEFEIISMPIINIICKYIGFQSISKYHYQINEDGDYYELMEFHGNNSCEICFNLYNSRKDLYMLIKKCNYEGFRKGVACNMICASCLDIDKEKKIISRSNINQQDLSDLCLNEVLYDNTTIYNLDYALKKGIIFVHRYDYCRPPLYQVKDSKI